MADANQPMRNGGERPPAARAAKIPSAFDPKAPALVQPFSRLVSEGWIAVLSATFTPLGVEVKGKASAKLVSVENSGLNTQDFFPVALLARVAELGNVIPKPGKSGKSGASAQPALPAKSLVKGDLAAAKSTASIQARANSVASACGGAPLVGRVRSAGQFSGTETVSYQDWWETASAEHRALSLCQGKHLAQMTAEEMARLGGLQCPFRGPLEFTVAEEEEEEEAAEE